MNIEFAINKLRSSHPSVAGPLDLIENIRQEISSRPLEEFFEPVSVIDMSAKQRTLESINPESLTAWTKHIAYSTQVRMGALESAILSELAEGRGLASMVMIRSHMEVAGLAALCQDTLIRSVCTRDLQPLKVLIPKTLFGTSMTRIAKKDEATQEMLLMSEWDTITIASAINAMDKFSGQGQEKMRSRRFYSLLCEFTHPNYRGVKDFARVLHEDENGWIVKYEDTEKIEDTHVDMALQMLSDNMRIGYAASELLRLARFHGSADGFDYASASESELERIWSRIIQSPIDDKDVGKD
ncbi:MAG: hypothetical protein JRJ38_18885 [Deltaproteobacteria bacterium]|nr:hypothetical protein [Deltaproteobacteria bacterium]